MKVKVPKKIKVGARTYAITFKENLLRDDGNRGCVYWHKQTVEISPILHKEQKDVTFLHECIHIIDEHMAGRTGLSEEVTNSIAEGLYQLLKDNLGIEFDWRDIK